jgi:hypothetical protein
VFNLCDISSLDFSGLTSLQSIGNSAFTFNSNLTSVIFTGCIDLQSIGERAFADTLVTNFDFSGLTSLNSIGNSALASNTSLTQVKFFDNSGCSLGNNVFIDLSGVSSTGTATTPITWNNSGFTIPTNEEYIFDV